MDKDPGIYVRHILDAITNIEMDTAGYDYEKFRKDRRARQLVEPNAVWSECRTIGDAQQSCGSNVGNDARMTKDTIMRSEAHSVSPLRVNKTPN
jgi:uncharacterized protein with HEPN domain